jgi:hypothetical protein
MHEAARYALGVLSSSQNLPPAPFLKERALSDALTIQLPFVLAEGWEVRMRREFAVGAVVPDLTCVGLSSGPSSDLLLRKWTYWDAHFLWLVRQHRRLNVEAIAEHTHSRIEKVAEVATRLLRGGALTRSRTGLYSLAASYSSLRSEVIAVESKLRSWREGLAQAGCYNRFANRVYIAIDFSNLPPRSALTAFRDSGIGLVGVSVDHAYEIVAARKNRLSTPEREYVFCSALKGQPPWRSRCERTAVAHALT